MLIFSNSDKMEDYLEYADQHDDDQGAGDAVLHKYGVGGDQRLRGGKDVSSQETLPRLFARGEG
jgi:hypothetical protein